MPRAPLHQVRPALLASLFVPSPSFAKPFFGFASACGFGRSYRPLPVFHRRCATMALVERLADKLEKPALDDRSYRVVRLPNKLEALLVHDPDTDKASASVNVNVGSFSDADDMPGMAHAVEHLLFMGTEKVSLHTQLCYSSPLNCSSIQLKTITINTSLRMPAIPTHTPALPKPTISSKLPPPPPEIRMPR